MAEATHRIVDAAESTIHDEPHVEGSRITVRFVHERVERGDLEPDAFADRYGLDLAEVYHALAYYHEHPAEMCRVEQRHRETIEQHREETITGPDDL